ncbi:PPOX class probable F420-dependent enzyme [Nakamurella sp. UYEF19]|uniref:pyridoxamine 5'-phosphate oxidase family protein n=1 Tax=Nakamurella sp. UYEF19 TaxID=1756392 RepID=UPI003391B2C1
MRFDPRALPETAVEFLTQRHLASLTTSRRDGSAHVVPVGFTFDGHGLARVITNDGSVKVRNADRNGARGAICQIDGRFWLTLEGPVRVSRDPEDVAEAVRRYAERYREPRVNPTRVVLLMTVDRIMGHL